MTFEQLHDGLHCTINTQSSNQIQSPVGGALALPFLRQVFWNYFALTQAASDNLAREVEAVTKWGNLDALGSK